MNIQPKFTDYRGREFKPADEKRDKAYRKSYLILATMIAAAPLIMAAATQINLTTQVQGILPVGNGGTGVANPTSGAIYEGKGSSAMAASPLSDNGTIVTSTESLDIQGNGLYTEIANASSTGTTVNLLAKLTGAPSTAVKAATTDTDAIVGVVMGGAGTSGNAQIAVQGQATCVADAATTAGDFVTIGSTTAGRCGDGGSTRPTSGQILGRWLATVGSAGSTGTVYLFGPGVLGYSTSAINFSSAETPSGSINGSNTSFTLAHSPVSSSLALYKNGQLQIAGSSIDYTLSGSTITYNTAPATGDSLIAFYRY